MRITLIYLAWLLILGQTLPAQKVFSPSPSRKTTTQTAKQYEQTFSWVCQDIRHSINIQLNSNTLKDAIQTQGSRFSKQVATITNSRLQKDLVYQICSKIANECSEDENLAENLVAFVQQSIGYNNDKADFMKHSLHSCGTWWQTPAQTIYLKNGICGDKSLLLFMLLKQAGYGTCLIVYPGHAAVSLKSASGKYRYVESTSPIPIGSGNKYSQASGRILCSATGSAY